MTSSYNIVASTNLSTVVSEYIPDGKHSDSYQSEAQLEQEFIRLLSALGYEYLHIHDENSLILNLRKQLEKLNNYSFTDNEWDRFFNTKLASKNEGIQDKTEKIQSGSPIEFTRDDGLTQNIKLIDRNNIHNNILQVINQYEVKDGKYENRYDVTILVNGLPLIHIELKRRGVSIRNAFNQIDRYRRDSFWAGSGLYEYIQIFIISNGTITKYYSNTTRDAHINEIKNWRKSSSKKTSNSFEFTSFWADSKNKVILDLIDFTKTFLAKNTILNILTKYCVFTADKLLLVMRPYQISACEKILNKIEISHNYKKYGTIEAGGYIWHTTGSGKTLTSFKAAQLAYNLDYIDKVLFVVDRKDLDYQTMLEYEKFEKGAANSNTSTKVLEKHLNDDNAHKIVITTIQKLRIFIERNKGHKIFQKHVVIIFDECHRSQFGQMHEQIIKNFKKYYLFGFTGTPIFAENAPTDLTRTKDGKLTFKTTPQVFGGEPDENGNKTLPLHTYTIVDAISDKNVLPFRIDYVGEVKIKDGIKDEKVRAIDIEKALTSPKVISGNTKYILEHFNQKTNRQDSDKTYEYNQTTNIHEIITAKERGTVTEIKRKTNLKGFNSIFAVSSIEAAKAYYAEFKKQMNEHPELRIKIGLIYSFGVNEDTAGLEEENPEDTSGLDKPSRDFLEAAIKDYNEMFQTDYDTSSDKFQQYYAEISRRMKNRELDLLIVVNMFLTGFDATTLNTLWVDKNLKYHGLIQAFSRTNRILNSVKTFGNIVCFRNLENEVENALKLFGDDKASGIVLLKSYDEYYYGYSDEEGHHAGYTEIVDQLFEKFPLTEQITGETEQKDFIKLFGSLLKIRNILSAFDQFAKDSKISERKLQDYQSTYVDLYEEFKRTSKSEKENINDDIEFEMELIKQVEINIDYILMLVAKYHDSNCKDKEIIISIDKAVDSSLELRSKKELIQNFIEKVNVNTDVNKDWANFVEEQKEADLTDIIEQEHLKPEETRKFIDNSFKDGELKDTGLDIDRILPPTRRFGNSGNQRLMKKENVLGKLIKFFEKYLNL